MKKVRFLIIVLLGVFILGISNVSATSYTLNDIVQKLEKSETYAYLNNKDLGTSAEITSDNHSVKIIYTVNDGTAVSAYLTEFYYVDGVLSYTYSGNKSNPTENDLKTSFVDAMWIAEVSLAVAELHGYTYGQLQAIEDELDTYTLKDNGLEMTTWNYEQNSGDSHVSMSGYDTFKININTFKLPTISSPAPPIEPVPVSPPSEEDSGDTSTDLDDKGDPIPTTPAPTPSENVENPNTGAFLPFLAVSALGVISVVCFVFSGKEKRFRKI